jgi:glycosyltransferase involved in cell wall biosynthesis
MVVNSPLSESGTSAAWDLLPGVPALSVLIPAYGRADDLLRNLDEYERQCGPTPDIEWVVVDDGSPDHTAACLRDFAGRTKCRFRFGVHAKNAGPATARNTALAWCRGAVVLITGDDIQPGDGFARRHLDWHRQYPRETDALLGPVTWPDALSPSPFMRWLETGGRAYFFNYAGCRADGTLPADHFYTSNVSVKRVLLEKVGPFDTDFPFASQEDLELGHRLGQAGMRLHFDASLIGYHWHRLTVAGTIRRVYLHGYSARLYWTKVPDPAGLVRRTCRTVLTGLASLGAAVDLWAALCRRCREDEYTPRLWFGTLFMSYWIGLSDAVRGRPVRSVPVATKGTP